MGKKINKLAGRLENANGKSSKQRKKNNTPTFLALYRHFNKSGDVDPVLRAQTSLVQV